MKFPPVLFIFLLLLFPVQAAQVEVNIAEVVDGKIAISSQSEARGTFKTNPEFINTGSVSYDARARVDILDGDTRLFTGWSKSKNIMPGDRKSFDVFWFQPRLQKPLTVKISMYYADYVKEYEGLDITFETADNPAPVFNTRDVRTYDHYLRFDLHSNRTVDNVVVFPSHIPEGWIIEQTTIEQLRGWRDQEVIIPYETDFFSEENITFAIVANDGQFYDERTFTLQKEEGFFFHINLLIDALKNVYRSIRDVF